MATQGGIRAGQAHVELYLKDSLLSRGMAAAETKLKTMGASLSAMGQGLLKIGTLSAGPLVFASTMLANMGKEMLDMAERAGFSVEALGKLMFAAEQFGVEVGELDMSLRRMARFLFEAAAGMKVNEEALRLLKIDFQKIQGLRPEEQFMMLGEALHNVQNPIERAALAMTIFGRNGAQILPIFRRGAEGVREMGDAADRLGAVISEQDAIAAENFGRGIIALWRQIKIAAFVMGSILLPVFEKLLGTIGDGVKWMADYARQHAGLTTAIATVVVSTIALGLAFLTLGAIFNAVGGTIGFLNLMLFKSFRTLFLALVAINNVLVVTLSQAITAYVVAGWGMLEMTLALAGTTSSALYVVVKTATGIIADAFRWLLGTVTTTLRGMSKALASGNFELAAQIAWLGLQEIWVTGTRTLANIWDQWFDGVYNAISQGVTSWISLFIGLYKTLTHLWNEIANGFSTMWGEIKNDAAIASSLLTRDFDKVVARLSHPLDGAAREQALRLADLAHENRMARINRDAALERQAREQAHRAAQRQVVEELNNAQDALQRQQDNEVEIRRRRREGAAEQRLREIREAKAALEKAANQAEDELKVHQGRKLARDRTAFRDLGDVPDRSRDRVDVQGTINAAVIDRLGGESVNERILAKSTEIARNTQRMLEEMRRNKLAFQ